MNPSADYHSIFSTLQKSAHPFVLYKKPEQAKLNILVQADQNIYLVENTSTDRGFIFAPFASHILPSILIRPDVLSSIPIDWEPFAMANTPIIPSANPETEQKYKDMVSKAVEAIKAEEFEKVVTSRSITHTFEALDLAKAFEQILISHPNAMVYYLYHPKIGSWIGASPELLISINKDNIQTMSLAGTLAQDGQWTNKERAEQNIVSVHIADVLDENHATDIQIGKAHDKQAGQVSHLCSNITAKLTPDTDILKLLKDLAPTPALGGFPKDPAIKFIAHNEDYKRTFYGGYLGELNISPTETLNLFVNIRCAEIFSDRLVLYVGGGITEQSTPEDEWKETERKSHTMGSILLAFTKGA